MESCSAVAAVRLPSDDSRDWLPEVFWVLIIAIFRVILRTFLGILRLLSFSPVILRCAQGSPGSKVGCPGGFLFWRCGTSGFAEKFCRLGSRKRTNIPALSSLFLAILRRLGRQILLDAGVDVHPEPFAVAVQDRVHPLRFDGAVVGDVTAQLVELLRRGGDGLLPVGEVVVQPGAKAFFRS